MILDEHGDLVWFKPLSPAGTRAADFRVQQYEGKPVLTWWQDPLIADGSRTAGEVIANSSYQTIAVVRAGNGYQPDLHEFQITPQGTALITVYDAIDCNLSSVGGPRDGAVADTLLQEIDLKTGLVMYEWHSLDHVPLQSSYASAAPTSRTEPFDYFHINSIDAEQDGDLLVDSRNTWAAYDVDPKPARCAGSSAASTRASSWAPGPPRRGSTTRASSPTARSRSSTTARPPRAPAVARDRTGARHGEHDGDARAQLRAPEPARRRQPGQRAGARERRLDGRLGPGRLPLGGHARRAGAVQRPPARRTGSPTGPTRSPGPASRPNRRRCRCYAVERAAPGATVYASWNGATERRLLAGARGVLPDGARAGRRSRPEDAASRPRSRLPPR